MYIFDKEKNIIAKYFGVKKKRNYKQLNWIKSKYNWNVNNTNKI